MSTRVREQAAHTTTSDSNNIRTRERQQLGDSTLSMMAVGHTPCSSIMQHQVPYLAPCGPVYAGSFFCAMQSLAKKGAKMMPEVAGWCWLPESLNVPVIATNRQRVWEQSVKRVAERAILA